MIKTMKVKKPPTPKKNKSSVQEKDKESDAIAAL
jgi:hypothetical protein